MKRMNLLMLLVLCALPITARAGISGDRLLAEAQRELGLMRSSVYQHKTSVDEAVGRFDYDCSGFLDYALTRVDQGAYAELPISKPDGQRPLAEDYFEEISEPQPGTSHWHSITRATDLRPGDIIAWLLPPDSTSKDTGHVMIVAEAPIINSADHSQVIVKVIDSAASGHAEDSRSQGQSGLGTGSIAIVSDPSTQKPQGFYWRANQSTKLQYTRIVFGRLRK